MDACAQVPVEFAVLTLRRTEADSSFTEETTVLASGDVEAFVREFISLVSIDLLADDSGITYAVDVIELTLSAPSLAPTNTPTALPTLTPTEPTAEPVQGVRV